MLGSHQVGVACRGGAEQIVHTMRDKLAQHWESEDFTVLKVDFSKAFNSVSRQSLLDECSELFPELLPWATWCYGSPSLLCYGDSVQLNSCVGVQQGDPLGPLLFCLVLHVLVRKIQADCPDLLLHKWYLDDGALAGPTSVVARALSIIRLEGSKLGLHLNLSKCELFSRTASNFDFEQPDSILGRVRFPQRLDQRSTSPHFLLLGSPIGDAAFCAQHIHKLRDKNKKLLDSFVQLEDPQVALHLLRSCASFCKFVYIARTTPPDLVHDPLQFCDNDVRAAFAHFAGLQLSDAAWSQAQLCLSSGGLGLRSTARHCSSAFISSHTSALPGLLTAALQSAFLHHAQQLRLHGPLDEQCISDWLAEPPAQRSLSVKLEKQDHLALRLLSSTTADRIRLSSVSSSRSAAWLQALPSCGPIDLRLSPDEMQVALQHRLGFSLSQPGDSCRICSKGPELDQFGHHHLTCSTGGYVVTRHNRLRDTLFALCSSAGMNPKKEQGAFHDNLSRPADLLVPGWCLGKPAAFDFTVVSPLVSENILHGAGDIDVVAKAAGRKHEQNDTKCAELGWTCVPLAVDSYGRWCDEAHTSFSKIASQLSIRTKVSLSAASNSIFNSLGIVLARFNARAILARRVSYFDVGAREVRQLALIPNQQ